jgi:hypothetical protein
VRTDTVQRQRHVDAIIDDKLASAALGQRTDFAGQCKKVS